MKKYVPAEINPHNNSKIPFSISEKPKYRSVKGVTDVSNTAQKTMYAKYT